MLTVAPVIVLTCDKYLQTLRGFSYLFNKYWYHEQPVLVVGYRAPDIELPPNFTFVSLGEDKGVQKWSDGLITLLNQSWCPATFTLFLEDYWLRAPVDTRGVAIMHDYMRTVSNVVKMDLALERAGSAGVKDFQPLAGYQLLESDPASQYHMSLYIGMWKRDLLKQVLIPGETPWDVEISGTNRLRNLIKLKVRGTRTLLVPITLAHRSGDPTTFLLDELSDEDRAEINKLYGK